MSGYEDEFAAEDDDIDYAYEDGDALEATADYDEVEYVYMNDDDAMVTDQAHFGKASGASEMSNRDKSGGDLSAAPPLKRVPSQDGNTFKVRDGVCEILPYKDVAGVQLSLVREVSNLAGVVPDAAESMLNHFAWNKEKLFDKYWADPESCLRAVGVTLGEHDGSTTASYNSRSSSGGLSPKGSSAIDALCNICFDSYPRPEMVSIGCGHTFCHGCYSQYLTVKVRDEGMASTKTTCPQPKCKERVPRALFKTLLEPALYDKYSAFMLKDFIDTSKIMRACPSAGCDLVAVGSGVTQVACLCGRPFCFRCGEAAHDPASCSQLAAWNDKCRDESETAHWLIINTKKCPKCDTRIEKNQGCNHMTCRVCRHEFCWICMNAWAEHGQNTGGFYKCNKFVSGEAQGGEKASTEAIAKFELERYLHYYTRFHAHDSSERHARNVQLLKVNQSIEAMQSGSNGLWVDLQFLRQAVLLVIECRRVLKYTYVLGYFLAGAAKQLFEYHQEMLEKNTDLLSEYTERPPLEVDRAQVVNFTRITDKFLHDLLESMMDGGLGLGVAAAGAVDGSDLAPPIPPPSSSSSSSSGAAAAGSAPSKSSSGTTTRTTKKTRF
jgi:ariadne-1